MTDYQTIRKLIHRLREADTKWQVTAQREMAERYREVLPEPVWQRLRSNHFNHAELELLDLVAAAGKRGLPTRKFKPRSCTPRAWCRVTPTGWPS